MRYFHFMPQAVIEVTGEDAFSFLQSQFSQDLRPLNSGSGIAYGLWLTRTGKIRADSYILRKDADTLLIVSPFCPASLIIAHLDRHIIADDVVLSDITSGFRLVRRFSDIPVWPLPLCLNAFSEPTGDALLLVDAAHPLSDYSPSLSKSEANYERLLRREPIIPSDITDDNWPQEAGLDASAVSFNKGCYLGQEVMAHLRRTQGFRRKILSVSLSKEPTAEHAPILLGEKVIGHLRTWASGPQGTLGMAQIRFREIGNTHSFSFDGDGVATLR